MNSLIKQIQIENLETDLSNKVDKVSGKSLSTEDYTTAEKDKLAALESAKFLGSFVSEAELLTNYPANGTGGNWVTFIGNKTGCTADVSVGGVVHQYAYDGSSTWTDLGTTGSDTAEMIKQKYESNTNTNAYTDAEKSKLAGVDVSADVNIIEGIKVNGTSIAPDTNKIVNIAIPSSATPIGAAGGDLTGTYPNPQIRNGLIPTALPNPQTLTFTGAVTDTYNGSVAKTINIPSGGGSSVPTGPADGDLTGTYPDPTVKTGSITPAKLSFVPALPSLEQIFIIKYDGTNGIPPIDYTYNIDVITSSVEYPTTTLKNTPIKGQTQDGTDWVITLTFSSTMMSKIIYPSIIVVPTGRMGQYLTQAAVTPSGNSLIIRIYNYRNLSMADGAGFTLWGLRTA